MTNNIIRGLLPDGHAPSVLKQEIKDLIKSEAPAADLTKLATKEELAAVTPTAEAIAKALGYALVVGENEPAPTTHGVRTVWFDTSNPSAFTPPAPVFSQKTKTVEIPSTKLATYKLGGAAVGAGVHRVDEPYPKTVSVIAEPAGGATFAVGAVTSWAFTFEAQVIPFDDAVLPLTSYLRLDDASDATVPRDRGTSPLTISTKYGGVFTPGAPGIGIGATSARVTSNGAVVAQFNPSDIRAYTVISVHKVNREHTQLVTLASLWSNSMPSLTVLTAKGAGTTAIVNFQNAGGAKTTTVNPAPALADGDTVVMVQTWDGTTIHGYVNGVEVVSIPWAGSTSTNDALKLVSWSAPGGGEISIAGLGFQKGEAKSAEWVRTAYEAAKRGAA